MAYSLSWLSIQWSLGDPYDVSLFAMCLLGSDEFWVYDQIYVLSMKVIWVFFDLLYAMFLSMKVIWVFLDLLYTWLIIASYFFSDVWILFGQLDLFILQWEDVLCDGFNLTVLDLNDRRGNDMHVSLLLMITIWGLFLHKWILSTPCHRSYCVTPFSMNLIH